MPNTVKVEPRYDEFVGMQHIVAARPTRTVWANKYERPNGEFFYGEGTSKANCLTIERNQGWRSQAAGLKWLGVVELTIETTVTEIQRTR